MPNKEVIRAILKHLGLWLVKSRPIPKAHAPPALNHHTVQDKPNTSWINSLSSLGILKQKGFKAVVDVPLQPARARLESYKKEKTENKGIQRLLAEGGDRIFFPGGIGESVFRPRGLARAISRSLGKGWCTID